MTASRLLPTCFSLRPHTLVAVVVGCAFTAAWLPLASRPSFGQERAQENIEPRPTSSEYRRVFVPAENVDAWPRNGEKFLPVESREFDAWVAAANGVADEPSAPVTISEAEYSARLENGQVVAGRGRWKIELRGRAPSFLQLRQTSLAIKDAHWLGSPQQQVRLGVWGNNGALAGEFGLEVPQSGTLKFAWNAPVKSTHDGLEIPWQLPPATTTRVRLDLPEGHVPRIDGGIVLSSKRLAQKATSGEDLWQWELGCNASQHAKLRIVVERPAVANPATNTSLHDDVVYQVTPRGLEMVATWTIVQTSGDLPEELAMLIPRELQLVSAIAKGAELPWRAVDQAEIERVRVVFRTPVASKQRSLQIVLRASYPLVLDKPWRLPKLRPEDVYWTSGDVTLVIAKELEMRSLLPVGCVERGASDLTDEPSQSETWRLVAYSPTADVEIEIARRQPEVNVRLGSSLVMADPDITGRLVTQWNVAQGKIHNLSGELAPGWVVETVETTPTDALGEWFIDQRNGRRFIDVQLSRPASAERSVSLVISGRLPRSKFTDQISASTLRMVEWGGARVARHVLAFETSEPFAVEAVGKFPIIDLDSMQDDIKALIASDSSPDAVFDLSLADKGAGVKLTMMPGQFSAVVQTEAGIVGQELHQEHHIVVTPTPNRVDRLLISATRSLGKDVRWADAASGATISAEKLAADDSRGAGLPSGSELWFVRLARPSAAPVEIMATSSLDLSQRGQLPLLAVPEAIEQQGRVLVRAETDAAPILEARGMTAIPLSVELPDGGSDEGLPIRMAYRFNPADCLESARAPCLWISPSAGPGLPALIARRVVLDSYYSSTGVASHRATYYLTNKGGAAFEWQLPLHATLQSISVDGRAVPPLVASTPTAARSAQLAVPKGQTVVEISFDMHREPLSIGSRLVPPLVVTDTPLLGGEWNIQLPEEFSISAPGALNWRQRLFGPLGRPDAVRPFQPFRAADWKSILNSISSAWAGGEFSIEPLAGWRTYRTSFVAEGPADVLVSNPSATSAWAASVFLLALVGGVWLGHQRRGFLIAMLALAGCLAFLLPAVVTPLAAGAVWGLLLSVVVPRRRPRHTEASASAHWHRFSTVGIPILVVIGGLASLAFGQSGTGTEDANSTQRKAIHRILIPVDANGRQAGTKYYVSEQFAQELLHAAVKLTSEDRQWLLSDVAYQGELRERAEPGGVIAGEFTITCDVEVLSRDTTIVLPFVQDEAAWPASAMLDGIPLPIEWRDGGHACAVKVSEPGRYSLVISLVPRSTVQQGNNVVKLSIQPIAGAKLRLAYPPELAGMSVAGATSQRGETDSDEVEHELDGTDRLEFRWPATDVELSTRGGRITQLEWLRISEGDVELIAKYIFEGKIDPTEDVVLAFDSEWDLLQVDGSPFKGDIHKVSADRESVRVQLRPGGMDRSELEFRWRISAGRSLGRLVLPPIELLSHPVMQRWRGVSATNLLECDVADKGPSSGTGLEFLALWGEGDNAEAPQIVLGNVEASQPWNVSTKPRQTESEIAEVLHVASADDELRLVYQADIVPGSLHGFQFPLQLPAGLSIEEITATQGDRRIPVRWSRFGDGRVNVFFGEELSKQFQLMLSATMRASENEAALPLIRAADSEGVTTVQLYRDDDVALRVRGLPAADESLVAPLDSPPQSWMARHVAGYRLDKAAAAKVRLQIQPNHVELAGDSVTAVTRNSEGWATSFQASFTVVRGTLDALQLRVPLSWSSTTTLDSSVPASITLASKDEQGLTLSIRFAESIPAGKAVKLRVDSPLAFALAGASVPQVQSTPPMPGRHYVCVPLRLEGQPVAWSSTGMRKTELPASLRSILDAMPDTQTFESTDAAFHMALQPQIATPHAARVRFADVTVSFDPRGGQLMTTRFIMEPQGLTDCTLRLPGSQQLVAVQLAGHPALTHRVNDSDWRVTLGPPQLPSILDVVSRSSDLAAVPHQREIRRPALLAGSEPIPVEINLWSLGYPGTTPRPVIGVTAETTVGEQAVLRFDQLLSIAEGATTAAIESPTPDGYNWYRTWAALLTRLRTGAVETLAMPDSRQAASQVSRPAEEQLTVSSARLEAWIEQCSENLIGPGAGVATPEQQNGDLTADSTPSSDRWVYCVTDGELDRLTIDCASNDVNSRQAPVIAVLAIVCLSAAAVLLVRRPGALDLFYHWPHAIGFLIGLACWAWLQPSWCGLLIAATCVVLALRSGWPGRAIRLDASTVLRASRPK